MERKGISELITIIIITGLTIPLAAFIFIFGIKFTKEEQKSVIESSEAALACMKVNFAIGDAVCGVDFWLNGQYCGEFCLMN